VKIVILSAAAAFFLLTTGSAFAADAYNTVSSDDAQFKQCKVYSMSKYEGGGESSPIAGQSKAEAFCTCMWNETPDDFKGDLAKFSETDKGAATNKTCEKYSNWGS
jgi:outer membrane biogenesis lipoprotein LolB